MIKKTEKQIKSRKLNREKKLIKLIKIKKNQPVRFRFYKFETEKTEPNRTQTEKNWKKIEPN